MLLHAVLGGRGRRGPEPMDGDHRQRLRGLIDELDSIVQRGLELEDVYVRQLESLHPSQVEAGRNLLHYLALRHSDIRGLQDELSTLGLSSLGPGDVPHARQRDAQPLTHPGVDGRERERVFVPRARLLEVPERQVRQPALVPEEVRRRVQVEGAVHLHVQAEDLALIDRVDHADPRVSGRAHRVGAVLRAGAQDVVKAGIPAIEGGDGSTRAAIAAALKETGQFEIIPDADIDAAVAGPGNVYYN